MNDLEKLFGGVSSKPSEQTIENLKCSKCHKLLAEQITKPFKIKCTMCKEYNILS